jgi:hypothetical protein
MLLVNNDSIYREEDPIVCQHDYIACNFRKTDNRQ